MDEFISSERHHAEVAALQNEIYRLTRYISDAEAEHIKKNMTDPCDPFDNPTEYHDYHDDYTEIQPLIADPEYKPEFEPSEDERSNLKSCYAVGGWCNLLRFFVSFVLCQVMLMVVTNLIQSGNPQADELSVSTYISGSSVFSGINMLVFGLTNAAFAFLGMKLSGQRMSSMIKTRNYTFLNFLEYSLIGFFLWFISVMLGNISIEAFSSVGIKIVSGESPVTGMGLAVYAVYTCIVAPVTEELFYRGMMLRVFSKANQRFGILCTALMFGLGHGNIPQFILGFILGIFFAHITLRHNSIIPAMIVHAVLNTMNMALSMIEFTQHEMELLVNIGMTVAFAGLLTLLFFRARNRMPLASPAQVSRGAIVAAGSIGMVLCVFFHIIYMVVNIYSLNI